MKRFILLLFVLVAIRSFSQSSVFLKPGDHAPSFIMTLNNNSIQSYVMPYTTRLVMLHFWSSDVITSRLYGQRLNTLTKRYKNAIYKNAEGFDVIAIAVQSDQKAWKNAIASDSLTEFTHGIALNGLNDAACKAYGIVSLPTDILIDETGTILAIDPKMTDLENILDDRKNFQQVKKDVVGVLAQSSNKTEVLKFSKLYLFNNYGDSIAKTVTSATGRFTFSEIKLNQDFILKVDNQTDFITTDPIALYAPTGDLLMDGKTSEGGFIFHIPARLSYKLTENDAPATGSVALPSIIKNLAFSDNGTSLTPKDEKELASVLSVLQKSGSVTLEFTANTDSKLDDIAAMNITVAQVNTLINYFGKKGIAKTRVKGIAKGNDEPRVICDYTHTCTEEEHKENRRVEFFIHRN